MSIKDKFYTSGKLKNEGRGLEYKEIFDWDDKSARAKYLKTIVSFANNKGGILVFGVADRPRKIVGLQDTVFQKTDVSAIEDALLENFDVCIPLDKEECQIDGKFLGILEIHESKEKPIICRKDSIGQILAEAHIFYRYNSVTSDIRYPDLKKVIEEQKESRIQNILTGIDQVVKSGGRGEISIGPVVVPSGNSGAQKVNVSDEGVQKLYPYEYTELVKKCKIRYRDFSPAKKFHDLKKKLLWGNKKYCLIRRMYPARSRDSDPKLYSEAVFDILDQYYTKQSTHS